MQIDKKLRELIKERLNILMCQLLELGEANGRCDIDDWQCRSLRGIPLKMLIDVGVLFLPPEFNDVFYNYFTNKNIAEFSVRETCETEVREIIKEILLTYFVEVYQEDDATMEMTVIKGYQLLDYKRSEMSFFHSQVLYEEIYENKNGLLESFIDIPYKLKVESLFQNYIEIRITSLQDWKDEANRYILYAFEGDYVKRKGAKMYLKTMEGDWITRWIEAKEG